MHKLPIFSKANIMVVGDVMLDRYWYGDASRISPEAPVPVVNVNDDIKRAGGAGNVALNIRSLSSNVQLLGIVGIDDAANSIQQQMHEQGVTAYFQQEPGHTTITKLRVMSQNQQLLRLDFEHSFSKVNKDFLQEQFQALLMAQQTNLIILSDYNKGTLSDSQFFINTAKEHNIPILVDPKGNDFSKYNGATLLTPNMKEFEAIVGHCETEADIVARGEQLIQELNLQALLITRGAKGMTLLQKGEAAFHLQAHSREVYDVTGAGDTVIATLAVAIAAGENLQDAANIANYAASIVVKRVGTASVTVPELEKALGLYERVDS